MNTFSAKALARRIVSSALLGALSLGALNLPAPGLLAPAMAHEAPCPYCNMVVSDATAAVIRAGRKRVEYKCVYCALAEAKTEYTGDLAVYAPSEKKGQPVVLKRTGGSWAAFPAGATFVSPRHLKHSKCQAQARAFTSKAAAQAFANSSGGTAMNLAQMNATVK